MVLLFDKVLCIFLIYISFTNSGRIVGNIIKRRNSIEYMKYMKIPTSFHEVSNNIENLICEKNEELFLEDSDFIKNKKLISISPGRLKGFGFYELGFLTYIKESFKLDNYIFSGATFGAWNALFMCYKNDTKRFIFDLLNDYKLSQFNTATELEYYFKYKILTQYNSNDFDLTRLFVCVTTLKQFKPVKNIFSDFNNLEDAINCCIASSHIPFVTGGIKHRYHNKYTFDVVFANYQYVNFTENVFHTIPIMWKTSNSRDEALMKKFDLLLVAKNKNYMQLFDYGYQDAKTNKLLLDEKFSDINSDVTNTEEFDDNTNSL